MEKFSVASTGTYISTTCKTT